MGKLQELLANISDPLSIIGAFSVIIALGVVYRLATSSERAQTRLATILLELAEVTKKLDEAEKIGNFGSFNWNFTDPSASFWSEEMYRLCGLVPRKKPPTIAAFIATAHEKDREDVQKTLETAQKQPGDFSCKFRTVAPSGQVRYLHVQGVTALTDKKQPRLIRGVAHDITLEKEVDRAKSEFVSLASHQLKTPLSAIKWATEALLTGAVGTLSAEQTDYMSKILKENQRMIDMVNNLLNVSRIELGTFSTQREELNLRELANGVIDEQKHMADEKRVTILLSCPANMPSMWADKTLVRMVFQNLISNSIKYTPNGGKVECEISIDGGRIDSLLLRVADTGIGIPKEEQGRVFERLHRATNAQALVPDGTGLGLYLVKMILDHAGGVITFESTEGEGTTFYASLPLEWKQDSPKK